MPDGGDVRAVGADRTGSRITRIESAYPGGESTGVREAQDSRTRRSRSIPVSNWTTL